MSSLNAKVADLNDFMANHEFLPTVGQERLKADYRMYGGMLFLLGVAATFDSFDNIAVLARDPTVNTGWHLTNLIAAVVQCFFGTVCVAVG